MSKKRSIRTKCLLIMNDCCTLEATNGILICLWINKMTDNKSFMTYLPSNSAGSESMYESENPHIHVSSWYKTTLDETYNLEGSEWKVGLAELCIPNELLSLVNAFEVGICIRNPPNNWMKDVRQKHIQTLPAKPNNESYPSNQTFEELDDKWEFVGHIPGEVEGLNTWSDNTTIKSEGDVEIFLTEDYGSKDHTPETEASKVAATGKPKKAKIDETHKDSQNLSASNATIKLLPALPASKPVSFSRSFSDVLNKLGFHEQEIRAENRISIGAYAHAMSRITLAQKQPEKQVYAGSVKVPIDASKTAWFKGRRFEIAFGKYLKIDGKYAEVAKIKDAFYASRHELAKILNDRMAHLLYNRSYPDTEWSKIMYEPIFQSNDNGVVSVICGFHDMMNGATSTYTYLVPTISSLDVLQFLGFDLSRWQWYSELKTFIFIPGMPGDSGEIIITRRDQEIHHKGVVQEYWILDVHPKRVYMRYKIPENYTTLSFEETQLTNDVIERVQYQFYQKHYLHTWSELTKLLIQPSSKPPQFLFVYADIASPVAVGNSKASLLRILTLKLGNKLKEVTTVRQPWATAASIVNESSDFRLRLQQNSEKFENIFYTPVSKKSFDSINIFLSDENGSQLIFNRGTVFAVLHFKCIS